MLPKLSHILAAFVAALILASLLPSTASAARTIYVSPTGDDTASGTDVTPLKTIPAAIRRAKAGNRIQLAPGSYPLVREEAVRELGVTIAGSGPETTQIAGAEIWGGQRLTFEQVRFTAPVQVQGHRVLHASQPAVDVTFDNAEFVSSGTCLMIREGARDIAVTDSRFRGCYTGIAGPGNPYMSQGIRIERNRIERSTSDAIQFGAWSDVEIRENTITDVQDPKGVIHNDGIQLTGNSSDVLIERNEIMRSGTQLIFIQDAIGPIDSVDVIENVVSGAGAVAVQSQGATNARFLSNTITDANHGGLWLRQGAERAGTTVVPTDTVLLDNVAPTIRYMEGATPSVAERNVVICPDPWSGVTVPPGADCMDEPAFAALAQEPRTAPGPGAAG